MGSITVRNFACELEAKFDSARNILHLTGPFAYGTPDARFLYLSYGYPDGGAWHWIRRIKIPLAGITWQQIKAACQSGAVLEVRVDGSRAGTVKLTGADWSLQPR